MRIVVAYKWTCDPEEATVRADGTVDWSRAKPGLSAYDPVAIEVARQFADEAGAELIGVTVGGKGVAAPLASKAALGRGLDRVVIVEDVSLADAGRSELAAVLAEVIRHIGDVDLVVTGDSSVDVAAKMVPTVLAASADAAAPRVPGMKDLLAAGKKPVELLELAALKVPPRNAVMTVTGRAVPERKPRKGQLIDTADPAKAAAELVSALRQAGTL